MRSYSPSATRGRTELIQSDPRTGIDLPLRVLVWSTSGKTWVAYRDPQELADEFALGGAREVLVRLLGLLEGLTAEAAKPA